MSHLITTTPATVTATCRHCGTTTTAGDRVSLDRKLRAHTAVVCIAARRAGMWAASKQGANA